MKFRSLFLSFILFADTDADKFLTLAEAAEFVRKPTGTVRYYIHHRNLPATKVGKSYLVKKSELLNWLEEFTREAEDKIKIMDRMLAIRRRYRKSNI